MLYAEGDRRSGLALANGVARQEGTSRLAARTLGRRSRRSRALGDLERAGREGANFNCWPRSRLIMIMRERSFRSFKKLESSQDLRAIESIGIFSTRTLAPRARALNAIRARAVFAQQRPANCLRFVVGKFYTTASNLIDKRAEWACARAARSSLRRIARNIT